MLSFIFIKKYKYYGIVLVKNLVIVLVILGTLGISSVGHSLFRVSAAPPEETLTPFTLDCGSSGSFQVGVHQGGFAKPIFVLNDNKLFRVSSLAIEEVNNGEPIFNAPGLIKSDIDQLTCHFVGAQTGRHFTVTGFFTPAKPSD